MKQLLEYVIPNIVNHPEAVVITEENQDGLVRLLIKVHPEDIGRVIGKSGKVIKAIRQLVRVLAIKQGVRVVVDVEDGDGKNENLLTETSEPSGEIDLGQPTEDLSQTE